MGQPCAAAGLICSKHVQIGRPTQTIKVEWRFCSTRHFCLTRGIGTPSKEQTDHKRKENRRENTHRHAHMILRQWNNSEEDGQLLLQCYSTSKQYFKHCLLTLIPLHIRQLTSCNAHALFIFQEKCFLNKQCNIYI